MKYLAALIFCISFFSIQAQKKESNAPIPFKNKNAVHLMLGGHTIAYGVYFERIIVNNSKYKNSIMLGGMAYPRSFNMIPVWLPITFNNIFSLSRSHHLELGAGVVLMKNSWDEATSFQSFPSWQVNGAATFGYRYSSPKSPLVMRVAITPAVQFNNKNYPSYRFSIHPLAGASIGYRF